MTPPQLLSGLTVPLGCGWEEVVVEDVVVDEVVVEVVVVEVVVVEEDVVEGVVQFPKSGWHPLVQYSSVTPHHPYLEQHWRFDGQM